MLDVIEQFAKEAPGVAAELRSRVEAYDYQGLLDLLEPAGGPA
jgi:hypothetical protein